METRDYTAIARQYARDVVSGKQPAGKSIRLQCERFLDELKRQRRTDFPYTFDPKKAAKVCAFIECLPHTKGKWASQRARLVLEPWQIWILALTFGWGGSPGHFAMFALAVEILTQSCAPAQLRAVAAAPPARGSSS